jgi:hypothetical protein
MNRCCLAQQGQATGNQFLSVRPSPHHLFVPPTHRRKENAMHTHDGISLLGLLWFLFR